MTERVKPSPGAAVRLRVASYLVLDLTLSIKLSFSRGLSTQPLGDKEYSKEAVHV